MSTRKVKYANGRRFNATRRIPATITDRGDGTHWTSRGKVKTGFLLEATALARAVEETSRTGDPVEPYRCATCSLWHIGGADRRQSIEPTS